jgi:hypothetical protein
MGDNWVFPSFEDYTGKEFIIDCFFLNANQN